MLRALDSSLFMPVTILSREWMSTWRASTMRWRILTFSLLISSCLSTEWVTVELEMLTFFPVLLAFGVLGYGKLLVAGKAEGAPLAVLALNDIVDALVVSVEVLEAVNFIQNVAFFDGLDPGGALGHACASVIPHFKLLIKSILHVHWHS